MTDDEVRARIAAVSHWYHAIEVRPGITTPGANQARTVLEMLDIPVDCRGMRALDLGTRDGFFVELERRGAAVVAIDYMAMADSGFAVAAELLGSRVTYLQRNLYDLTVAELGTFDIVLFLGMLYQRPLRRGDARRDGVRATAYSAHRRPLRVRLRGEGQSRSRVLHGDRHRPACAGKRGLMNRMLRRSVNQGRRHR